MGLYYSPAQADIGGTGMLMDDPARYDDYFIAQITELLDGRYGAIDMLWFDGCGSENHQYDWPRIIGEVRWMQPNILIFNMADPDYRWVGNEAGIAPLPSWNVRDGRWLPVECDLMLRDRSWFHQDADAHTIKSVQELMGIYDYSVGRGANMLLNVGPDRRGLLPPGDGQRLLEVGEALRDHYKYPLAVTSEFVQDRAASSWTWKPAQPVIVDHIVAAEDLSAGEVIRGFAIEITPYTGGPPIVVYEGRNMGHKAICTFSPVRVRSLTLRITEAAGTPNPRSLTAYHAARSSCA